MFALGIEVNHHSVTDVAYVRNALRVFLLVILKDKPLLTFFDKLPIGLKRAVENCVASKHELGRSGSRCGVNGCTYGSSNSTQNTFPAEVWIDVIDILDLKGIDHLMNNLVDSLHNGIGLRVSSGNKLALNTILFFDESLHFCCKLSSSIHDNLCWPWIAREPRELHVIGDVVCPLIGYVNDLEPSGCGIYHCQTMKISSLIFISLLLGGFAQGVGAYKIDT
jgi:hypothetical protein